jgi:hypothetical protein
MTLKIAVFAAMPSASVRTATAVNPGAFFSSRNPMRASRTKLPIASNLLGKGPSWSVRAN